MSAFFGREVVESDVEIDTSLLDCVQANLATVAIRRRGEENRIGARIHFRPRSVDGSAFLTVEPTLVDHLNRAEALLGVRHDPHRTDIAPLERLVEGEWRLVVQDAYDLPWVPYFHENHTDHSYLVRLLGEEVELVDAYTNDTPWGLARPRRWQGPLANVARAVPDTAAFTAAVRPGRTPSLAAEDIHAENAREFGRADYVEDVADYVSRYHEAIDGSRRATAGENGGRDNGVVGALARLTVETWLIARSRAAYSTWLSTLDVQRPDAIFLREYCRRWAEVAEGTYLAMRRVRRGHPAPDGVVARVGDLLYEDPLYLAGTKPRSDASRSV